MFKEDILKENYSANVLLYNDFCKEFVKQIKYLIDEENISLATPLSYRVKTWTSILGKVEKYDLKPTTIQEINDFAGLRIILLFNRDVSSIIKTIDKHFIVLRKEDTIDRLKDNQFGYGSVHFELQFPENWLGTPTLKRFAGLTIEVQVRTNAQHIWASTSHLLQYKNESSTPIPLRRSLNRTAALLEMVDLEFERLLREREEYISSISEQNNDTVLDVEILKDITSSSLPDKNKMIEDTESYSLLLENLVDLGINTKANFIDLISENLEHALKVDQEKVTELLKQIESEQEVNSFIKERVKDNNVYYSHVGLVRKMLRHKFGEETVANLFEETKRKKKRIEKDNES